MVNKKRSAATPLSPPTQSSLEEKFDSLQEKLNSFQKSLSSQFLGFQTSIFTQLGDMKKCFDQILAENKSLKERLTKLELQEKTPSQSPVLPKSSEFLKAVSAAVEDHFDRNKRKMNLVLIGLPEPPNTNNTPSESDKQSVIDVAAQLSIAPNQIVEVSRQGRPHNDNRPRITKVVFANADSRRRLLTGLRSLMLKDATDPHTRPPYYARPDLTRLQLEALNTLNQERLGRIAQGEDVVIFRDNVILRTERDQLRQTKVVSRK